MSPIQREKDIFLTALMFFTRVPIPAWANYTYDPSYLQLSSRYFPLVGLLVGAAAGGIFWLFSLFLPPLLAVLLSMTGSILVTGAFHEDGFADVCDGFGGGMTKMRVLEIMKDSRLGTYGTLGLILILSLKASALLTLVPTGRLALILMAIHAFSRLMATSLIYTHRYVRENEDSKAKPLATSISIGSMGVAAFFGSLPLLLLPPAGWLIVIPVGLVPILMGRWFQRRIDGYTGDCLGAVQQVSEVVAYVSLVGLIG